MPWSLAHFNDRLFVGINSLGGARVLYTPNGSSEDGSWFYSMGGDSPYPYGFDGKSHMTLSMVLGYKFIKILLLIFMPATIICMPGL